MPPAERELCKSDTTRRGSKRKGSQWLVGPSGKGLRAAKKALRASAQKAEAHDSRLKLLKLDL